MDGGSTTELPLAPYRRRTPDYQNWPQWLTAQYDDDDDDDDDDSNINGT